MNHDFSPKRIRIIRIMITDSLDALFDQIRPALIAAAPRCLPIRPDHTRVRLVPDLHHFWHRTYRGQAIYHIRGVRV
ncbi:hypothetical protein D3C86_2114180 [compost metagenome]